MDVKLRITELNPHLICALCGGYLIDATTVIECLHSFCKTCILRYLETSNYCPICEVLIHKTRPWQNIRLDHTLQTIVYKVVPGLFKAEMKRRRDFYDKTPATSGTRLAVDETLTSDRIIYSPDEHISVCLRYSPDGKPPTESSSTAKEHQVCRYLLCPAAVTMHHLKKIIRLKSTLPDRCQIDVFHADEPLRDHHSLMDVAYIYSWRRQGVMKLFYSFFEPPPRKRKRDETETTPVDVVKDTDVMAINEMKTEPEDVPVTKTHKEMMTKLPNGDLASPSSASESVSSTSETCDILRSAEVCSNADDVTMSPSPEQVATDLRKDSNKSSPLSPSWNTSPVSAPVLPPSSSSSPTQSTSSALTTTSTLATPSSNTSSGVNSKSNTGSSRSSNSVSKISSGTSTVSRSISTSAGSSSTKISGVSRSSSSGTSRCSHSGSSSSHTLLPAPAHASSKPKSVSDSFPPKNLMKRSESKPAAPPAHSIASITGSVLFGPRTTTNAHQPMRKELSSLYVAAEGAAMTDHGPVRSSHAAEAAAAATSPGEPEKSPAKDARKPSDMEHLFATSHSRWHHSHSHPHSDLVYNGHYQLPVRDRYPQDLKGDLPLDFSQSSTSTSS